MPRKMEQFLGSSTPKEFLGVARPGCRPSPQAKGRRKGVCINWSGFSPKKEEEEGFEERAAAVE